MVDLITYETIRAVHRAEKEERLQKLPEGFFSAVSNWIDHKKLERDTSSLLEIENAKRILDDLINRRQRKIILAALRTIRGEVPPHNLTEEEQKFFDRIVFLFKEFKDNLREQIISYDEIVEEKLKDVKDSLADLKTERKETQKEEIFLNAQTGMITSRPVKVEEKIPEEVIEEKPAPKVEETPIITEPPKQEFHQEPSAPIIEQKPITQKIELNEEIWQEAEKIEIIISKSAPRLEEAQMETVVSQPQEMQKEIMATPEVAAAQKEIENFNVKLLNNLPRFVGNDLKPYGPFAREQKALLPENIVDLLVMRKVGVRIG